MFGLNFTKRIGRREVEKVVSSSRLQKDSEAALRRIMEAQEKQKKYRHLKGGKAKKLKQGQKPLKRVVGQIQPEQTGKSTVSSLGSREELRSKGYTDPPALSTQGEERQGAYCTGDIRAKKQLGLGA